MIKFLLVMQVCSAVQMDCMTKFEQTPLFETHSACTMTGHLRSITIMNNMGNDFVERARISVRFKCEKINDL